MSNPAKNYNIFTREIAGFLIIKYLALYLPKTLSFLDFTNCFDILIMIMNDNKLLYRTARIGK
jgi:hypothetical protein